MTNEERAVELLKKIERLIFKDYCNQDGVKLILTHDDEIRREMAKSIYDEAMKLADKYGPDTIETVPCNLWWWQYSQNLNSMILAAIMGE